MCVILNPSFKTLVERNWMIRSSTVAFVVCAHMVCLGGGDEVEMQPMAPAVVQEPAKVSVRVVYEKIKEVVPSRPRRFQLLKEDDVYYEYLMKDLEQKGATLPHDHEDMLMLREFCSGKVEHAKRCGAVLATLMSAVKEDAQWRRIYGGELRYFYGQPVVPVFLK